MSVALVTDGDERAALAIVRSLGAAGQRCIVGSRSGRSLAGASRYAAVDLKMPDPGTDPAEYATLVEEIVRSEDVDLVIPVSESALLAVLPVRARIPARIPFPDLETFKAVCDKARVLEAATAVGIRIPEQQEVASAEDVGSIQSPFPVVLKPSRSVYTAPDGTRGKVGVRWGRSHEMLAQELRAYPKSAFPILVQEAITGPGIGIFVLIHKGQLLASFAHRRIREKPPSGGVSVMRQSEPMDKDLLERSIALLRTFEWSGVAMVEYKRDARTGEAVLMEINGRFWGSLQLAIDAGVDFPRILSAVAAGEPVIHANSYRFIRSGWFWGNVDHILSVWRSRTSSWQDRLKLLTTWVTVLRPSYRSEVFRWTDPMPFVRESMDWLKAIRARR